MVETKRVIGKVVRTAGYLCYVDKEGNVCEVIMNRTGRPKGSKNIKPAEVSPELSPKTDTLV